MNRRNMAVHSALVLSLVVGIVGGNFLVHRWLLNDVTSRTADAGTTTAATVDDLDLSHFAPRNQATARSELASRATRERLAAIVARQLPDATAEEQESWLEQLQELTPEMAEDILDLRRQFGPLIKP